MTRWKSGLSMGVIVALAVAIWAAVSSGEEPPSTTTTTLAAATSTIVSTTTTAPPTTTVAATSAPDTTTDSEVRIEEVRLILEDLYFRWFDAIYRNDEEAVLDVVALPAELVAFRNAVENLELPRAPTEADVVVTSIEVLRDTDDCVVTYSNLDLESWRGGGAVRKGVDVLYPYEGRWRLATHWANKNDLWETDCDAVHVDELP